MKRQVFAVVDDVCRLEVGACKLLLCLGAEAIEFARRGRSDAAGVFGSLVFAAGGDRQSKKSGNDRPN